MNLKLLRKRLEYKFGREIKMQYYEFFDEREFITNAAFSKKERKHKCDEFLLYRKKNPKLAELQRLIFIDILIISKWI